MKKLILGLSFLFVFISSWLGIMPQSAGHAAAAGVNNFIISDYQIDYYLDKDADGRSTLKTTETIKAIFPESDQNHGIERALPLEYDGHKTNVHIQAVTNAAGDKQAYSTRDDNNNLVLRIGDASRYVHGTQTYTITYTQRDVTRYFDDTQRDEFYWDTNGTDWAVPISNLTARVHVGRAVSDRMHSQPRCYVGVSGATTACSLTVSGATLTAKASNLAAHENMTLAIGFQPETFVGYQQTVGERLLPIWLVTFLISMPVAVVLITWFCIRFARRSERKHDVGPIPPEYLPPKHTSVAVAATLSRKTTYSLSAQLIDLAVRHYLKIYQTREARWFRSAQYELEIVKDIGGLLPEERELVTDIFPGTAVGTRLDLQSLRRNTAAIKGLRDNAAKLTKAIEGELGLRAVVEADKAWFKRAGLVTLVAAVLTLSPALLVAAIVAYISAYTLKPLTDKGVELTRYIKGLELYIKLAETDRLKALQSPEGALKLPAPIDTNDKRAVVKLYERVLPYAILFGHEKEWNKRLGQYYESIDQTPYWLVGSSPTFNAATFGAAVSGLNTAASYTDPSSSSSGGSSGGGSSGGGGGGGGGGGW